MGNNGVNAVLNTARLQYLIDNYPPPDFKPGLTFPDVGRVFEAVEGIYGIRGGRRLARQTGQVCFKYSIEGFGGVVGFADFALRILPISLRMRIGLEVLSEILNRYSDQQVSLGENDNYYFFVMNRCGFCWQRQSQSPACMLAVGLLEESLYWVTRGQRFWIEETMCAACGHPMCTVSISKKPLSQ